MPEIGNAPSFDDMVREAERHALYPKVSLAANTIHNPAEARHYMSLREVPGHVSVTYQGMVLAKSDRALVCLEVGKLLYFPIYYLPRSNTMIELRSFNRETHCPLKGDASYHALPQDAEPIAWSYDTPFDYAEGLRDRIAFDPARVTITISQD